MSANQWVAEFKELHERARRGQVDAADKKLYLQSREKFARALVASQGLTVPAEQSARHHFRIAQGMQVDLSFADDTVRVMTLEVSCQGFSVMMHKPSQEQTPGFSLRLPGGAEPLVGRVKLQASLRKTGNHVVSYAFMDLPERERDRLEIALFDLALARIP
jgi:predicted secreted hydrolase